MSETTSVLGLTVIDPNDSVDFNVLNNNFSIIDNKMKPVKTQKGYLAQDSMDNSNFTSNTNPVWSYTRFSNGFTVMWMTLQFTTGDCKKWGDTGLYYFDYVPPRAFPRTFVNPPVVNVQWGQTNNVYTAATGMLFTLPPAAVNPRDLKNYCPKIRAIFPSNKKNVKVVISISVIGKTG